MAIEKKTASQSSHIDDTIEVIEKNVENETSTGVAGAISKWITTLENHKELKPIATTLVKLKEAIADKDNKKIVELMTKAGDATIKAAEDAEGDESKKIKMLGKCLVTAAKAISKLA